MDHIAESEGVLQKFFDFFLQGGPVNLIIFIVFVLVVFKFGTPFFKSFVKQNDAQTQTLEKTNRVIERLGDVISDLREKVAAERAESNTIFKQLLRDNERILDDVKALKEELLRNGGGSGRDG